MFRKTVTMLLALLLVTTTALAESSKLETAKSLVPETAILVESDYDDGLMEYEFQDGLMRYEVVMKGDAPAALIVHNAAVKASREKVLAADEITAGMEGEILFTGAAKDDGRWVWKVIVWKDADLVEYEFNAETGEMLESETYFAADLELPAGIYRMLDLELDDGRLKWERD